MKVPYREVNLIGYAKGVNTMAIVVNTNMSSLRTQNNLNSATNALNTSLERMSTGYKINSAKDDAAGMYVATNMNKLIGGSKIAQSNIETGNNVLSTVEGNLDVILDNLNRIRDLTVQASNGVYDENSQKAMSDEVKARLAEIDRIAVSAEFNGLKLLDGTADIATDGLRLQVGANAAENANCIRVDASVFQTMSAEAGLGLDASQIEDKFKDADQAAAYISTVDDAIKDVNTRKATIGAIQNRLDAAASSLTTTIENATAAKSTIMDADIAEESAEYTKQQILRQTSASLLVQANALPSLALTLIAG